MCPLQLPRFVSINFFRSTPYGTALSGIVSPRTPSTHSTSKPVNAEVNTVESLLSVRSGSPITRILPNPSDALVTRLMSAGVERPLYSSPHSFPGRGELEDAKFGGRNEA